MIVETDEHLYDAMNLESSSVELRTKAELLHHAMNDWPTQDISKISDFLREFEDFFGSPVTINSISNKSISMINSNSWRFEAGEYIKELIQFSSKMHGPDNISEIISEIVDYYKGI